jgi:heat shock protein HslJ
MKEVPVSQLRNASKATLLIVGACLVALFAAAGCSSGGGSGGQATSPASADPGQLESADWRATEIGGSPVLSGADAPEVTAVFAAGDLSGSGGVNRYAATYEATTDGGMTISQPGATLMAGPPKAMAQEAAYFAALKKVTGFTVTADSLTLIDDQGTVLVRFEAVAPVALQGTIWKALAYNNGKEALVSVAAGSEITAEFGADGMLIGNASVNHYSTKYSASDGTMTIMPDIVTTKMAGPEKLMKQEAAYLAALPQAADYTIEGDELWLRGNEGAVLAQYVAAPE